MRNIITLIIFFFHSLNSFAQCSAYPNIDFEQGNFNGWQGCTGQHPNYNPPTSQSCMTVGIVPNRFTVLQSPDSAQCVAQTYIYMPGSGNYSIQLGEYQASGALTEQLSYSFIVLSTDTVITYLYALIGMDPGHSANDDVFFEATILDANNNTVPGSYTYILGAQTPFCNWTPVTVNLGAYIGQQVTIRFTNADCALGGHHFNSYVDIICGQLATAISNENILYITSISPNPSNGKFILKTSTINFQFVITNILGEKILERKVNSEQTEINLENQKSGIYFYQMIAENKIISTGKLVIE